MKSAPLEVLYLCAAVCVFATGCDDGSADLVRKDDHSNAQGSADLDDVDVEVEQGDPAPMKVVVLTRDDGRFTTRIEIAVCDLGESASFTLGGASDPSAPGCQGTAIRYEEAPEHEGFIDFSADERVWSAHAGTLEISSDGDEATISIKAELGSVGTSAFFSEPQLNSDGTFTLSGSIELSDLVGEER